MQGNPLYFSHFTLKSIHQKSLALEDLVNRNYWWAVFVHMITCTLLSTLAIPITGLSAMMGGFAFGIFNGLLYTVIAMTIGSIVYVLIAQRLLHNILETRYVRQLDRFNERFARYGYTYLISLHLLTVIPFFVVNSLAALAHVPIHTVAWTTALGIIPGTLLYTLAGRELSVITSASDIFKPHILIFLVLLACIALLPMLARHLEEKMGP